MTEKKQIEIEGQVYEVISEKEFHKFPDKETAYLWDIGERKYLYFRKIPKPKDNYYCCECQGFFSEPHNHSPTEQDVKIGTTKMGLPVPEDTSDICEKVNFPFIRKKYRDTSSNQITEKVERLKDYIKHNCIYPPQTSLKLFKEINKIFGGKQLNLAKPELSDEEIIEKVMREYPRKGPVIEINKSFSKEEIVNTINRENRRVMLNDIRVAIKKAIQMARGKNE